MLWPLGFWGISLGQAKPTYSDVCFPLLRKCVSGTWVAHSVECLTLDFGSGHALTMMGSKPHVGLCARCGACWRFSLRLSFSLSPCLSVYLSAPLMLSLLKKKCISTNVETVLGTIITTLKWNKTHSKYTSSLTKLSTILDFSPGLVGCTSLMRSASAAP